MSEQPGLEISRIEVSRLKRVMGSGALVYPNQGLEGLSEKAQYLYHEAPTKLDRNNLPAAMADFISADELDDVLAELTRFGLLTVSGYTGTLNWVRLHDDYTVAFGSGSSFIQVEVLSQPNHSSGKLLASIVGGDIDSRLEQNGTVWSVHAEHLTARDAEHSKTTVAELEIFGPTGVSFHDGIMTFTGTLLVGFLYPLGVDPTKVGMHAGEHFPGDAVRASHPYADPMPPNMPFQYLPGYESHSPVLVKVIVRPYRPYQVTPSKGNARDVINVVPNQVVARSSRV